MTHHTYFLDNQEVKKIKQNEVCLTKESNPKFITRFKFILVPHYLEKGVCFFNVTNVNPSCPYINKIVDSIEIYLYIFPSPKHLN